MSSIIWSAKIHITRKVIIAIFLLLLCVSYGYASTTKRHRTCGERAASSALSAFIVAVISLAFKKTDNDDKRQEMHVDTEQTPRQDTNHPPHDTADTLTDIGLAHIGRITACDNPYMTPEQTAERHKAEHPFTKALAERYPDGQTRKALSRHFMLYKEFTLFLIFSMVLRNNKPLHARVQSKLKGRLSLGLPSKVIAKRNEYWRRLSEKFFESYKQKKDIAKTLDYVFWSVLPDSVKGKGFTDLAGNGSLMRIFEYTRKAIEKEYKAR